jgi:NADH-quinone oxidoreductase subunit G/NADP-reducing hydrogenase subunit HndD
MATIEVNGRKTDAHDGETILTALRRAGVTIPTLCHVEGLEPSGACRMCVVEVEGAPGLVPSCAYPVADGMKIKTHSPRVVQARKTIVELLLADHPDDCLYCIRNGDCQLQRLAEELGVRQRRYIGNKNTYMQDVSSPSIERDPSKCILCGRCVRVCEEYQGVSAIDFSGRGSSTVVTTAFDEGLNVSSCVYCGQCVKVCPTGALRENSAIKNVTEALNDPDTFVVVQHAPAISVTMGEEFGIKPGHDTAGALTSALRRLGFDRVFDTSFSADLTIMEEATELAHRIQHGGVMPMITSCCPAWIKFAEQFFPGFLPNISSCKSPQQMLGAVIKSFYAQREGIDPSKIYSVAVMPCTAKKFEAQRTEMSGDEYPDIDAVLTTREMSRMIRTRGIDLRDMDPDTADTPFGERTGAGKIFGASGGVTEAAARTAHYLLTGKEMASLTFEPVRGMDGIKETTVTIGETEVTIAVANGLGNARALLERIRAGHHTKVDFIEVMACSGGCVAGGGQPREIDSDTIRQRTKALYAIDDKEKSRVSHHNTAVQRLYDEFLGSPYKGKSHTLLHTAYGTREVIK